MAKITTSSAELTAAMKETLNGLVPATVKAIQGYVKNYLKGSISNYMPDEKTEAEMLSKDTSGVGTPEGDRFLRKGQGGEGVSARKAVKMDTAVATGNSVFFGDAMFLNNKTVFSWIHKGTGQLRTTEPFNHKYMQALEWGGVIWIVEPRAGTKVLNPEDDVYRRRMFKTLYPHQMFTKGSSNPRAIAELERQTAEVVKKWLER